MTYLNTHDLNISDVFSELSLPTQFWDSHDSVDVIDILTALLLALLQDMQKVDTCRVDDLGWRNKYNIHLLSQVSQKRIYREFGVIERLVEDGIIKQRPSRTRWGKQKFQYRLRLDILLDLVKLELIDLLV